MVFSWTTTPIGEGRLDNYLPPADYARDFSIKQSIRRQTCQAQFKKISVAAAGSAQCFHDDCRADCQTGGLHGEEDRSMHSRSLVHAGYCPINAHTGIEDA